MRRQPPPALQEAQLHQEGAADDLGAQAGHEIAQGARRPAGGQQVVVDEHPGAVGQRIGVDLEGVETVLEGVLGADRLRGQLAGLARGHEPGPELAGQRRPEDEAARLGGDDVVNVGGGDPRREAAHRRIEGGRVQQQRRDVAEQDPRPREVRDVADEGTQIESRHASGPGRRVGGLRSRSCAGRG